LPSRAYAGGVLKLLLVVILVAVVVYLTTRAIQRRGIAPAPARRPSARQQHRIIAPDDDPEFLRDLDRKRRHPEDPES
jgi:hypothetical protein